MVLLDEKEEERPVLPHKHEHKKDKKKHKRKRAEEAAEGAEGHGSQAGSPPKKKHHKKHKKRRRVEEGKEEEEKGVARSLSAAEARGEEEEEEEEEEETPRTAAGLAGFSAAARACFPELTAAQWTQLEQLGALVQEWNGKVNVISRKDIENVLPRHVLPCMGIAKLLHKAPAGTRLMDVGTGGGFPGLPLAIACPHVRFLLVDSIGKKIRVVADMARRLGLSNVEARHTRVEEVRERFHFVTGRSVTAMARFVGWVQAKFVAEPLAASAALPGVGAEIRGGILYIKGGIGEDVKDQVEDLGGWVPTGRFPITQLIGGGPRVYDGDKAVLHFDLDCLRKGPKGGGAGAAGAVVAGGGPVKGFSVGKSKRL
jgi:16S rRNA (guanine527-N7)-methyltransferase